MWIYIPSTSYQSVPESDALISESSWQCQMLEQSATWKGKHLPAKSWSGVCKKVTWMKPLFGRIWKLSRANRGVEKWIASLPACHANHIPLLEKGKEKKTKDTSGHNSFESLKKCVPPWCSSKTYPTFFPGFNQSEMNYPRWVIGLKRDYSRRKNAARHIGVLDGFVWATPTAKENRDYMRDGGKKGEERLVLTGQAKLWATIRASEKENRQMKMSPSQRRGFRGMNVGSQATILFNGLQALKNWKSGTKLLKEIQHLHLHLNPKFCEWLMGIPIGWTVLEPLEMPSFPSQQLLDLLRSGKGYKVSKSK